MVKRMLPCVRQGFRGLCILVSKNPTPLWPIAALFRSLPVNDPQILKRENCAHAMWRVPQAQAGPRGSSALPQYGRDWTFNDDDSALRSVCRQSNQSMKRENSSLFTESVSEIDSPPNDAAFKVLLCFKSLSTFSSLLRQFFSASCTTFLFNFSSSFSSHLRQSSHVFF